MSAPVSVGDVVGRKYRIDRVLGEGGMGVVVAATDTQLERRVAIKFLLPGALANPEIVARFSREARAAAKIQSEHVVRVIEVGELDTGTPYMVMEYLEGRDLAERIRSERVSASDAARFVLQACEALAEAHAAGIVHRDLKPANLFLAQQPDRSVSVKVLDFGISKAPVGSGGITSTQAVMGSPHYMSPEQLVSAKHVDHRSDVWSLGIVLYEMLAGSPPFTGDTMPEIVAKILQSPLPSLHAVRPDVPAEIEQVIARCTAKDPTARFRDVAELAHALVAFAPDAVRSADRATRILGRSVAPPSGQAGDGRRRDCTVSRGGRAVGGALANRVGTYPGGGRPEAGRRPLRHRRCAGRGRDCRRVRGLRRARPAFCRCPCDRALTARRTASAGRVDPATGRPLATASGQHGRVACTVRRTGHREAGGGQASPRAAQARVVDDRRVRGTPGDCGPAASRADRSATHGHQVACVYGCRASS